MKRMLAWIAVASFAAAEEWQAPKNTNAALGYWRAFSLMKDLPTDEKTSALLANVLSGKAAWDEETLGKVVDENQAAISQMRRASRLPDCCFGLDYDEGASMLLPHLAKARALGKLNVLSARRAAAEGRTREAIDALVAGLRFAEHFQRDGTLITALVARAIMGSHLRPLLAMVGEGKLSADDLAAVQAGARAMAPYGFDWGAVIASEKTCFASEWKKILESNDPVKVLDEGGLFNGQKATLADLAGGKASAEAVKEFGDQWHMDPKDLNDAEKVKEYLRESLREYDALIDEEASAMRLPYYEARDRLAGTDQEVPKKGIVVQIMMPAIGAANRTRGECEADRAGLIALSALAAYRLKNGKDAETLDGLDVPTDPYSGKAFDLAKTDDGIEVRSAGKTSEDPPQPIVYRLRK